MWCGAGNARGSEPSLRLRGAMFKADAFTRALFLGLAITLQIAVGGELASARAVWHPTVPPSRSMPALALDSRRHALVLYGGWMNTAAQDYAWEIPVDTARAFRRIAAGGIAPPLLDPLQGYSAAYDSISDRVLLFGGYPDGGVWTLSRGSSPRWEVLQVTGPAPPPRLYPAVAWDPAHRRIAMFGGSLGGLYPQFQDDVWVLELGAAPVWRRILVQAAGPAPRDRASLVYDPKRDRFILMGGRADGGSRSDAWSLSLGDAPAWSPIQASGVLPAPRSCHIAVFDAGADRMIVHGGEGFVSTDPTDLCTLQFTSPTVASWSTVSPDGTPPRGQMFHRAVYDAAAQNTIIYGGWIVTESVDDCTALNLAGAPRWIDLAPGLQPPPARACAAVRDPRRDRLIVISERSPADIWWAPLDAAAPWTHVSSDSGPSPRFQCAVTVDSIRDQVLLFGGYDADVAGFCDTRTWSLSLSTLQWSVLATTGGPPPARGATGAAFDDAHERMLMYGGAGIGAGLGDLWELNLSSGATWSLLQPAGLHPAPRAGHAVALDPTRGQFYVSGGDSANWGQRDIWRLSLDSLRWTKLQPLGESPGWCSGHVELWDSSRDALMLFGSQCSGSTLTVGVWTLDAAATQWTRLHPLMPTNRGLIYGAAVRDPVRDRVIVLGGGEHNDTDPWILGFDGAADLRLEPQPPTFEGASAADLTWVTPDASVPGATLYRKVDDGPFHTVGHLEADLWLSMAYREDHLLAGSRYSYQMVPDGAGQALGQISFAAPPAPQLRVRCYPSPARGQISLHFTLPDQPDPKTKIEMFDVQGRRVFAQDVGAAGRGDHAIDVPASLGLHPGLYLVRLAASGGLPLTSRVVMLGGTAR